MHTYSQAFYTLKDALQPLYDLNEAVAIAHEIMEWITGLSKLQRLTEKDLTFTPPQQEQFETAREALLKGKPLQYIVGTAWFLNRPYKVNEHVLIPRPETEELVMWIVEDYGTKGHILDIGTGSGCIPISLKLALADAIVDSLDVSDRALSIAKENAHKLHADVHFMQVDFLDRSAREQLGQFDIIVSNPPYIPLAERETLHINVRDYEPATALFVPDSAPLLFYTEIAAFGKSHLRENGSIYCELHRDYATQTQELFEAAGYKHVAIRLDMHGNPRMLKATLAG